MQDTQYDKDEDIFGDVVDTELPTTEFDPSMQLYILPENVEWFLPKREFTSPKDVRDCTSSLVMRFLSWKISEEGQNNYAGTGLATPGTLRNQLVVRYHPIPDGFGTGGFAGRAPCQIQFGAPCSWCAEKAKTERRFPREQQPEGYFRDVIAKFKPKDKTLMLFEIWEQDDSGNWYTDGNIRAMEFSNYLKSGRPFVQILNDRANDADKRIRIDKKSYAGYVNPMAIKVTFSWPVKSGKPDRDRFATWVPTDATPFPTEAGGPDVSQFTKEWAHSIADVDPALWINKTACNKINPAEVGKWVYDVFTGVVSKEPDVDLDTCDFGELLTVMNSHKAAFDEAGVDPAEFDYTAVEALRAIVKGVLCEG